VNILKHMEAVFVVALAAVGSAGYLVDALPDAQAQAQATSIASIATPTRMAVVTVCAKRPSPSEKQRLLQLERCAPNRA
jgi:hypothetical protein